jgi:hypothetical protein
MNFRGGSLSYLNEGRIGIWASAATFHVLAWFVV